MDTNKLANILLIGGIALVGIAILWWMSFYGSLAMEFGKTPSDTLSCLYSSGGPCGFVAGFAQMGGKTPYSPFLFWIGVVAAVIGGVIKATQEPRNRQ